MLTTTSDAPPVVTNVDSLARQTAGLAHRALIEELETWPKPGLVSLVDPGSHQDMDARTLRRSAAAVRPFLAQLVLAGASQVDLVTLRTIGVAAEAAMTAATGGINAHRGAIFSLGLICAAEGATGGRVASAEQRAAEVRLRWGNALRATPATWDSHGGSASRRFGVGGATAEAAAGFPTVCEYGLPALRRGRLLAPGDPVAARVHCFFALLAVVDDTNLLHRGGAAGLAGARAMGAAFLADGGVGAPDWQQNALTAHHALVAQRLSPGGCADLLAATLLLDALETRA